MIKDLLLKTLFSYNIVTYRKRKRKHISGLCNYTFIQYLGLGLQHDSSKILLIVSSCSRSCSWYIDILRGQVVFLVNEWHSATALEMRSAAQAGNIERVF